MDEIRTSLTSVVEGAERSRLVTLLISLSRQLPRGDRESGRGQGLAEYSLILGGIAVVAVVSMIFLGGTITDLLWAPIDEEFARIVTDILGIGA
ncbi:MAG: Flp family type IVb pilin [Chloroflexota bacterium]